MKKVFKIASWNVNSIRVRLEHVLSWLKTHEPDVLALQETKIPDALFPHQEIKDAGYDVIFNGQAAYNGVAILTKHSPSQDAIKDFATFEDPQRRILGVTINDIHVLNLYVPNGESVESEKYKYKLNWLNHLTTHLKNHAHEKMIILGDFNIAPHDLDVHDPESWQGKVIFSEPERSAFQNILDFGFVDCLRQLNPEKQIFTWWDYRLNSYKRNLGLRIDHILATNTLACTSSYVDNSTRELERPSDHAPVIAEFVL